MAIKFIAPALLAAAAAALISAPSADAADSADCDASGPASVCTRNGHASIFAEPQRSGGAGMMFAPGMPFGPWTPVMAMD